MNRGKSLFGSSIHKKESLLQQEIEQKNYSRILQNLKTRPGKLRQFIAQYRRATTQQEQHRVYSGFRKQQQNYKSFRQQLKDEFNEIKNQTSEQDSEYNYVRNQLVQFVKQEMNIDLQMNQLIEKKRKEKEAQQLRWENLEGRSLRVQNALDDIIQKTNQILQLESSIKECLDLLEIIGVLVKQQGDKIQIVQDQVRLANQCIEQAQKQINIAKIRMERATRKKCCVIIVGLIVIVLIIVVLYGVTLKNL